MKKIFVIYLLILIFSSGANSQWVSLSSSAQGYIQDICFFNSLTGCYVGNNGLVMGTPNGGNIWYWYGNFTGYSVYKMSLPYGTIGYAACDGGVVMKTVDNGLHWSQQNTGATGTFRGISFINSNTGIAVGFNSTIRYTTNGGLTWLTRTINPPVSLYSVNLLDANNSLAVTSDVQGAFVWRSTDAGINWQIVYGWNNSPPNIFYNMYSICFLDNNTGFVSGSSQNSNTFNGVIFRTINGGVNWSTVAVSSDNTINSVYFVDHNTGYVTGNNGVILYTSNSGINWNSQISGTANSLSNIFFINSLTGFAVGANGTVLKTTNGGITGFNPPGKEIPTGFSLSQNYPNPFNPSTKIKFDIPYVGTGRDLSTTLKVYNMLGEEVATLVNEQLNPGTYEVDFDGSNFPSGVYYYKLTAGNYAETKKMILLK